MQRQPTRPRSDEFAEFYAPYIAAVKGPLRSGLVSDIQSWSTMLTAVPADREVYRYEPGKWSLREVVSHVADAERIFCARMLAFARGDESHYPSFDENLYVANSGAADRPLRGLVADLAAVRTATILLLGSFADDVWDRRGVASGYEFTVRSLAWIIAGHSRHHRLVVADRYLT